MTTTNTSTTTPCARLKAHLASAPEAAQALPKTLAEHAAGCAVCTEETARARALVDALESLHSATVAPKDLADQALARAAAKPLTAAAPARKAPWGFIGGGLIGAAAAAAVAVATSGPSTPGKEPSTTERIAGRDRGTEHGEPPAPTSVPIEHANVDASKAADDGLAVRACLDAQAEVSCDVGRKLATEIGQTRAFRLTDGTLLHLDQDTAVSLDADARAITVERGEAFLDVAHHDDMAALHVTLPTGEVEVIGTALDVRAGQGLSVVDVVRGVVAVSSAGSEKRVRAGQAAYMAATKGPVVRSSSGHAGPEAWSAKADDAAPGYSNIGFGSLRARRAGANTDADLPLRLVDHVVTTRIQGMMARTVVEESFASDERNELEGTYRFTLPAGAQVADLSLLVDGKWEDGAFVSRDKAEKIWAGVIRNATPIVQRREVVEYIWVPGPWRDPALLSWKQGNTFELRIFPIPAHGERRVKIAYTERLPLVTGGRRYTLPLPADKNAARAERFSLDLQVGGDVDARDLRVRNYQLTKETVAGGIRLATERRGFRPTGDLVVEVPDESALGELTGVGFAPSNHDDAYVAFTLRPDFATTVDGKDVEPSPIDVALVVDTSYGIQKLRLERAAELARELVKGLDSDDHVTVLACSTRCSTLAKRESASSELAERIQDRLAKIEPLGTSRLGMAFQAAAHALRDAGVADGAGRIIYMGDGINSTGELDASHLASEVRAAVGDVRITSVGLGGEVDDVLLGALGKDHGGSFLDLAAIGSVPATARTLIARQHGEPLRDAKLTLPEGVERIAPADLGDLWPGDERVVTGRVSRSLDSGDEPTLSGDVVLTGTIGGESVDRKWSMAVPLGGRAGNAFVPRLWAEARIADLSSRTDAQTIEDLVQISQDHHVLSRYTSLLVLESPAMAKAFGVETQKAVSEWSGESEQQAQAGTVTGGTLARSEEDGNADALANELASSTKGALGKAGSSTGDNSAVGGSGYLRPTDAPATATPEPAMPMKPKADFDRERRAGELVPDVDPRGGRWVAMKKVWFKVASVRDHGDTTSWEESQLDQREQKWDEQPNSRERTLALVRWHIRMGALDEAERLTQRWLERDRMDTDALVTLADIAARRGDMVKAEGWLASAVDADHRSSPLQARLADLYLAEGDRALGCEHRLARALVARNDVAAQVDAIRCDANRERIMEGLDETMQAKIERQLDRDAGPAKVSGPFKIDATWGAGDDEGSGRADLDVVVVSPSGRVVSRLGGAVSTAAGATWSVEDATDDGRESLSFKGSENGRWQVFVVRHPGTTDSGERVEGTLRITAHGTTRRVAFVVGAEAVAVAAADIDVQSQFRYEPAP
ncbi:MAG: FecR domain-containing protein [Myxococcota bacterium]